MVAEIIEAVATIAIILKVPPQEIMQWRESQFILWAPILFRQAYDLNYQNAVILATAVWSPRDAAVLRDKVVLTEDDMDPKEVAKQALTRASEILKMTMVAEPPEELN